MNCFDGQPNSRGSVPAFRDSQFLRRGRGGIDCARGISLAGAIGLLRGCSGERNDGGELLRIDSPWSPARLCYNP